MELDDITTFTLDDLTLSAEDSSDGGYEQFIGSDAPDFDPFTDYDGGEPVMLSAAVVPALIEMSTSPVGAAYALAHNMAVRRAKIWACWGTGIVVGWIGDAAHQSGCSDHNIDAAHLVHAIDPMVTGTRAEQIVTASLVHPGDLQYIIHNRVIWSSSTDWKPRKYTGSDPHTNHVHLSGKHGKANSAAHTCTGYDLTAQNSTPVFDLCPTKPTPPPVKPTPPQPKPPAPKPTGHQPGTRELHAANPDMTGDDVLFVQKFIGEKHAGAPDGRFGDGTTSGVRWYQGMRGLHVDGIVGKNTWAQMGVKWHK